ncbi:MAG: ATP-binding cassette domain-containing protein, partial [Promethearchaeota archaeon]
MKQCPITLSNARKKPHQKKAEVPIRFKKSADKMIILSEFCISCGVCLNVCPRHAIYSIFLLDEPESELITHEYPPINTQVLQNMKHQQMETHGFRLFGLPTLIPGRVTGLCGPNGIGKSTVLNILSGDLQPNFGELSLNLPFSSKEYWKKFLNKVRDSEMRAHFYDIYHDNRRIAYKQQVLRIYFEKFSGQTVSQILKSQKNIDDPFFQKIWEHLDIETIAERELSQCSGGELQRFAIASVLIQDADCYLIDEPCTFLDVKKRIKLAELLQARANGFNSNINYPVLVVEHDLAILDYLSDVIHLFYGKPHQFGVITNVQSTKAGINAYLTGFLKTENIQFRKSKITFRRSVGNRSWENARIFATYGSIYKTFDKFKLEVSPGTIYEGEILGIVGENGTGKSTFAKILAGKLPPDSNSDFKSVDRYVSYKPQYITRDFNGSVQDFIMNNAQNYDFSDSMKQLLYSPLGVDKLLNSNVRDLSGGQLQRVFIATCLAKRAELYILDEPSA